MTMWRSPSISSTLARWLRSRMSSAMRGWSPSLWAIRSTRSGEGSTRSIQRASVRVGQRLVRLSRVVDLEDLATRAHQDADAIRDGGLVVRARARGRSARPGRR